VIPRVLALLAAAALVVGAAASAPALAAPPDVAGALDLTPDDAVPATPATVAVPLAPAARVVPPAPAARPGRAHLVSVFRPPRPAPQR